MLETGQWSLLSVYNCIVWSSCNVIASTTHFLPHPLLYLSFPPSLPHSTVRMYFSLLQPPLKFPTGQLVRDILNVAGFTLPTKESSGDMWGCTTGTQPCSLCECCTGLVQWIMWHFSYPACRRSSGTELRPLSYEEKTKVCMYISKLLVSPLLTCVCACTYSIHSMDVRCVLWLIHPFCPP